MLFFWLLAFSPTGVGSHKSKGLSHYLADFNQRGLKIDLRILDRMAREFIPSPCRLPSPSFDCVPQKMRRSLS